VLVDTVCFFDAGVAHYFAAIALTNHGVLYVQDFSKRNRKIQQVAASWSEVDGSFDEARGIAATRLERSLSAGDALLSNGSVHVADESSANGALVLPCASPD
jgi:hypothetical protein